MKENNEMGGDVRSFGVTPKKYDRVVRLYRGAQPDSVGEADESNLIASVYLGVTEFRYSFPEAPVSDPRPSHTAALPPAPK